MNVQAILLAGGAGKRMRSQVNKVLFPIAGRLLLDFPMLACRNAGTTAELLVVGAETAKAVDEHLRAQHPRTQVCIQTTPRGTGDAVAAALPSFSGDYALIACGDAPLVRSEDIAALFAAQQATGADLVVMTAELAEPAGYGRVLRDDRGHVVGIREHKDLETAAQRAIREVNAGTYLVEASLLREAVAALEPNNAQGEYYLTDIVAYAAQHGKNVQAVTVDADALRGVNDRQQLAEAEEVLRERIRRRHRLNGASVDPTSVLDDTVELAQDVSIKAHAQLRGVTRVDVGSTVDVGCVLTDTVVQKRVVLLPYCVCTASVIEDSAQVGPFAHLRPNSRLGPETRVGNFVETKDTHLHQGAKAGHLSYLGNSDVGQDANLGAGTIFCNYDGVSKHRTVIGAGAFVGSDSQFVAPVSVGQGAFIAAGSTVTEDVPDDALVITRGRQVTKLGYAATLRERASAKVKP